MFTIHKPFSLDFHFRQALAQDEGGGHSDYDLIVGGDIPYHVISAK